MIQASVPVHLGPPRTSHASRALLGSLLVVLVVLSISPTAAVTVRITCHDGSPNARVASKGHHRTLPAVCDLDGAVDGICTFYSEGTVLKCAINGGPGCQDVSDDSSAPPCPFSSLPIALPLGHAGHAAKRIRVAKNGVYPSDRLFNSSLDGNARRAIDIHEGEEVDESAFKALVRQAVALNSCGKSKPSKKAKS